MVRNNANELEQFKKTAFWNDIVDELDMRISMRQQEMEDPDGNLDVNMLYRMQGAIKAYREVRDNLLDSLIAMSSERTE